MTTYEFRLDYADGTYSVERVDADTLVAAYDAVRVGLPNGTSTMLLCMIDRTPQRALAFS